jgi:hypothetical protein
VVQVGQKRAAGAQFCLAVVKKRWEQVEGGSIEVVNVLSDGLGARDRAIARVKALWAKLTECEPPGLGFALELSNEDGSR